MTISCLIVTGHSDLPETHLLIGLFRKGVELEVMCPPSAPHRQLLVDADVPVFDLSLNGRFDRGGIAAIKQRLMSRRVDILHAFNNQAVSNSLIASKGYDCQFIAYRGIEGNVSYYDPMSWTTYLHPRVDVIVCVADAIRRYFMQMRVLGFPCPVKKAMTIYKGHHPSWYQSVEPVSRQAIGVPEDALVVGCTVNDRPRKGLPYLVQATQHLPADLPIHFVLIGHVNAKNLLRDIEQSPYRNRIHLLGFQQQAPSIMAACDICILPAIKREGLPKGIIEGMIQGVAPIVTDTGGSPELIETGVSGLVIPAKSSQAIADAVMTLYRDRAQLESIKQAAKARIANDFPHTETIRQHWDLYHRLAGC